MQRERPHSFNAAHLGRYRRVINVLARHGFGALFSGLRLGQLLNLPERIFRRENHITTPASHLRMAFEELGGSYVKLGQMLSTRPDLLPIDFIEELSKLQDQAPQVPWEKLQRVLKEELGVAPDEVFSDIDPKPLASASLGQVHAAKLISSSSQKASSSLDVVIKIQRPRIEKTVQIDLDILYDLAWRFQNRPEIAQFADPVEVVQEFASVITAELDYQREANWARRFHKSFAKSKTVYIPKIYWEHCTRRVLVMERLHGIKVSHTNELKAAGLNPSKIATNLAELYMKSIYSDRFFHADPHPGNIWALHKGHIALLDFGRVGSISARDEAQLFSLVRFIILKDARRTAESLLKMEDVAQARVDQGVLERDVSRILEKYIGMPVAQLQFGQVLQEVMNLAARHRLRLPSNWVVLLQTFAMLEGVLNMLDPNFDVFAMARPHVERIQQKQLYPETWVPPLLEASTDWYDLWRHFPKQASKLIEQAEQGKLGMELQMPDIKEASKAIETSANRLSISLLVGALIIAIGFVLPLLNFESPWSVITWVIVLGFGVVFLLGMWLVISMWQSDKNHKNKHES